MAYELLYIHFDQSVIVFRTLQASPTLQDISIEAKNGELLMLIGPVGAGKVNSRNLGFYLVVEYFLTCTWCQFNGTLRNHVYFGLVVTY